MDDIRATDSDRRRLERFERRERGWQGGADPTAEIVQARLDESAVRRAVQFLRREERELVCLVYWRGLSHSEIAASTGLPVGTVKSRLRTGLRKLGQQLGSWSVAGGCDDVDGI